MNRMHTTAEKLIYEKLHDRLVTDFNEVPDEKKKEIDIDGAKLSKEFEFILVPATKYVSGIKTMFIKKPVKTSELVSVERQVWDCKDGHKVHMKFTCGDEFILIRYSATTITRSKEVYYDVANAEAENVGHAVGYHALSSFVNKSDLLNRTNCVVTPYQTIIGKYQLVSCYGESYKELNTYEELLQHLVDFVVTYTKNFKLKRRLSLGTLFRGT